VASFASDPGSSSGLPEAFCVSRGAPVAPVQQRVEREDVSSVRDANVEERPAQRERSVAARADGRFANVGPLGSAARVPNHVSTVPIALEVPSTDKVTMPEIRFTMMACG
jgi:hypothetical protein